MGDPRDPLSGTFGLLGGRETILRDKEQLDEIDAKLSSLAEQGKRNTEAYSELQQLKENICSRYSDFEA